MNPEDMQRLAIETLKGKVTLETSVIQNEAKIRRQLMEFASSEEAWSDNDYDHYQWARKTEIIYGTDADTRKLCKSFGNSNAHCICALETDKGLKFGLSSICQEFFQEYKEKK
jgi:hypothetical protein